MALLGRFRRKQEDEASRVNRLSRTGRIVEGRVLDVASDVSGNNTQVFYSYNIAGVEYESSQVLNTEQHQRKTEYAPGTRVIIRYDPHQPANSIVV